ncbi:MAG: MBOAT family protein [Armatimonadetes bacterium]|nr:MBOAT family protein [Armatimonadota bacterium]
MLLLISLVFLALANPWSPLVYAASAAANWLVFRRLTKSKDRKSVWLCLGVVLNVLILGFFKYADSLIDKTNSVFSTQLPVLDIALPLGLSFLTFQQIAFLVDAHREKIQWRGLGAWFVTVFLFAKVPSGPILRHNESVDQVAGLGKRIQWLDFCRGLTLLSIGLFKKVVIADTIAAWSDKVFDAASNGEPVLFWAGWIGAVAYALQLYYDFSGYCDMALGVGHMFGIALPINFDRPYRSTSVSEFWRRWHITLGAFLRDYLYIPLGGNRRRMPRVMLNLFVTMVIAGVWHGAGWTFVIWGALHGVYLALNALIRRWRGGRPQQRSTIKAFFNWAVTFVLVVVAWVPFRAEDYHSAIRMWRGMTDTISITDFGATHFGATELLVLLAALVLTIFAPSAVRWVREDTGRFSWRPSVAAAGLTVTLLIVGLLMIGRGASFIYVGF